MPRQSNGTYTPPGNTAAVSGQAISSAAFNLLETDIATELTNSLDRLGRAAMQADLPMGGHKISGLANGILATDAVTLQQLVYGGPLSLTAAQQALGQANLGIVSAGGLVNKFRNPAFDIWQRGSGPFTVAPGGVVTNPSGTTVSTSGYVADGWQVLPVGGSVTVQPVPGRLTTVNALQITGAAGVTDVLVRQRIESLMAASLSGQNCTTQVQIYNGTGATFSPTVRVSRPTSTDAFSGSTVSDLNDTALQSCASGAWTLTGYTFAANAASKSGLSIDYRFGALGVGKTIAICEADLRATPGSPVGLNAAPPSPELRFIAIETVICQRYYKAGMMSVYGPNATTTGNTIAFGVVMRAAPTVTNAGTVTQANAGNQTIGNIYPDAFTITIQALSANSCYFVALYTASAEL